jgi:hypothetical protein
MAKESVRVYKRPDICRRKEFHDMATAERVVRARASTGVEKAPYGCQTVAYAQGQACHLRASM